MLNQIVLVGRLAKDVELHQTENDKNVSKITLAIPRSFKNSEGVYDTDFIDCTLWDNVAMNTSEYCKKGDIIGVKGRMQSRDNKLELVAEKVSFLTKSKEGQEEKLSDENLENKVEKDEDYER